MSQVYEPLGRSELEPMAIKVALQEGIPQQALPIFLGLIDHESGWNHNAKNPKSSARGLGQHLDSTLADMGHQPTGGADDPRFNPELSLRLAARHLIDKYSTTKDWRRAVNAYGENNPAYIRRVEHSIIQYAGGKKQGIISQALQSIGNFIGPTSAEAAEGPQQGIVFEPLSEPTNTPQQGIGFEPLPEASPGEGPGPEPPTPIVQPETSLNTAQQGQKLVGALPEVIQPVAQAGVNAITGLGEQLAAPGPRPYLEMGGLAAGEAGGATLGGPPGAVIGGGLGFGAGKKLADIYDVYKGIKQPETWLDSLAQTAGKDIPFGAFLTMGGQVANVALGKALDVGGKLTSEVLGKLSGVGKYAIEEAVKAGNMFKKALRGTITGEEVVENAHAMLRSLKNQRTANYLEALGPLSKQTGIVDDSLIQNTLRDLMARYRIKVNPDGTLDTSTMAIGNRGIKDVEEMINTVWGWPDKTPLGLDALKRRLQDFYSESSQARGFTTELSQSVIKTLEKNVPGYVELTKPYAEATKLIKDIESNLMMRKQGISGRITADQTLRRLSSAMRENFEMRNELVKMLGQGANQDLAGQISGYTMSSYIPRGLAGTGPLMVGETLLIKYLNPALYPILAASSPRLQGEFLMAFGRALKQTAGISEPFAKISNYLIMRQKLDRQNRFAGQPQSTPEATGGSR